MKALSKAAIILSLAAVAAPAAAFDTSKYTPNGSLSFEEIMPLIKQSAKLAREVAGELARSRLREDDVLCLGVRFGNNWVHLGGARVSPYVCEFRKRWLHIRATVRVTGRKGEVYTGPTRAAMRNAANVTETKPVWKWTNEPPPDK
jgi:hypothetical protein